MIEHTKHFDVASKREIAFEPIQLNLRKPDGDKNWMIVFEAESKSICHAYNSALRQVLEAEKLMPFHQIGTTHISEHEPGYHGWEVWQETSEAQLQSLLPKIQVAAQASYDFVCTLY